MTKEEIKKWFFGTELIQTEKHGSLFRADETARLINKFEELIIEKDQKTESLKAELAEYREKYECNQCTVLNQKETISQLQSELTELKERHQIIFDKMLAWVDDDFNKGLFIELFNEGYKQKFESND